MGLFKASASDTLFDQLKTFYSLQEKTPYEESIMGTWWEGSSGTVPFAFKDAGRTIRVYLGEVVEITDIMVCRNESSKPHSTKIHLERILGPEGAELAAQFYLGCHPNKKDFDIPKLRLPEIRDGIPKFSASVTDIGIYEGHKGMSLSIDADLATVDTIERDVKLAQGMVKTLQRDAGN